MADSELSPDPAERLRRALSIWENEDGGNMPTTNESDAIIPDLTNAELVHLRVRVIALENLMIAILAEGSDAQRELALDMADIIHPRPGFTQHPLTVQGAHHMTDLVHRADHFRTGRSSRTRPHHTRVLPYSMRTPCLPGCARSIAPRPGSGVSYGYWKDACDTECLIPSPRQFSTRIVPA